MKGLMMDFQLTVPTILRRAESLFGEKEIISQLPDKSIHHCTYKDFAKRTRKLAAALKQFGVLPGDRVATLGWNHHQHMEAYFAIPSMGAIVHPLNLRLSPDDLSYIVNHAEDKILIVDQVLLPLFEKFKSSTSISKVIVIPQTAEPLPKEYLNYEVILDGGDEQQFESFEGDENTAAFMCYTSGTTGRPKGILYSHRSIVLHSMAFLLSCSGGGVVEQDVVLPVVPMFHAAAWGFPFSCAFVGATQVFPGPHLDAESLLRLLETERVTITAGVPTIMRNILNKLDADPHEFKLSLRLVVLGGAAAPQSLIESFQERHGIKVLNTWGMTEMSPLGTTSVTTSKLQRASKADQYKYAVKQGMPVPFVEIRGRNESGLIPWDANTMGELEVRGPWVAASYYLHKDEQEKFTDDGWLRTGDIVTITEDGFIEITDRSKDLIKSGGEWISSVALENSLMDHPLVLEAAVIAIPHESWIERPFAFIVLKAGGTVSPDELKEFLGNRFAKFWLPDGFAIIEAIPKTSVGKFLKSALREKYLKDREA